MTHASPVTLLRDPTSAFIAMDDPQPLLGRQYMDAHVAFETASTQQSEIRQHVERTIVDIHNSIERPLNILSLGCGSGILDLPILYRCDQMVGHYTGVDPNGDEIATFRNTAKDQIGDISDTLHLHTMTGETFFDTPSFKNTQYDIILCSHVLYYVQKRKRFIAAAAAQLSDAGALLIAHAPRGALNQLAQAFWSRQHITPFFNDELEDLLLDLSLSYERRDICGLISAAMFDPEVPQGRLVIEFIIQSMWDTLSEKVQGAVLDALADGTLTLNAAAVFPHPASVFCVSRP